MKKVAYFLLVISGICIFLGAFFRLEKGADSTLLFVLGLLSFLATVVLLVIDRKQRKKA